MQGGGGCVADSRRDLIPPWGASGAARAVAAARFWAFRRRFCRFSSARFSGGGWAARGDRARRRFGAARWDGAEPRGQNGGVARRLVLFAGFPVAVLFCGARHTFCGVSVFFSAADGLFSLFCRVTGAWAGAERRRTARNGGGGRPGRPLRGVLGGDRRGNGDRRSRFFKRCGAACDGSHVFVAGGFGRRGARFRVIGKRNAETTRVCRFPLLFAKNIGGSVVLTPGAKRAINVSRRGARANDRRRRKRKTRKEHTP